jgi:flavodoxin I
MVTVRAIICYASFSSNTKEVAELISQKFISEGFDVDLFRVMHRNPNIPDPSSYDVFLLGSFTWAKGATPKLVKDFV